MNGKISSIWRVVIAMVLVLSLGMVMALPVAASVGPATVTPYPPNMSNSAEYTITFTTNEDLAITADDDIRIRFPEDTTVPGGYTNNSISINGTDVDTGVTGVNVDIDVPTRQFIIDVPMDIPSGTVIVVFKDAPDPDAGIVNPSTKGFYTLEVSTSREVTWVTSYEYEITGPVGPVDLYLKHVAPCGYIVHEYVDSYPTIQDALGVADLMFLAGDFYGYGYMPVECNYVGAKIDVHPGTYDPIVIDTPFVEVVSTEGRAVTFIDGTVEPADAPAAVYISAGGVTFDGFTVMNAGVGVDPNSFSDDDEDGDADIKGIGVDMSSAKNSALIYNALGGPIDITDGTADMARVNILNNEVYGSTAHGIIVWEGCVLVSGNNVHDNEYDGFLGLWVYNGVETLDPTAFTPNPGQPYACTEINDNTFADNGDDADGRNELDAEYEGTSDNGIQIKYAYWDDWCDWWEGAEAPTTIYIVGNEIYRNSNAGIYLGDGIDDMVVIKFNQIEYNDVFGISSHMRYPLYDIVCIYNDIVGNEVWGIKNWEGVDVGYPPDEDDMLIATLNYWGHLSGPSCGPAPIKPDPSQQSDALGQGDAVSHYVEYRWWLTDSFKIVRTGLIRHYGSDLSGTGPPENFNIPQRPIVLLKQGWNTMSTPVALDQRADQMGEIVALGGWMQKLEIAFTYDPVNGFQQIVTGVHDPALMPLEAILVKMKGPETYVDLQDKPYADRLPILLRTTNYLPARDLEPGWNLVGPNMGFWSQDWRMDVEEVLSSIGGSWGVAISPDMPGQRSGGWVCTPTTAADNGYEMFVGDGYWVFVTKSTTLAGFRMAPWYLQDWEMDILDCKLPPWWPNNR